MNPIKKGISSLRNRLGENTLKQLSRYLITGFTAFGIEYGLYVVLFRGLRLHYITASILVYALAFWFVFLMNRYWSFESKGNIRRQILQYALLFLFNLLAANVILMYFLTDILGISPYFSPVLKTGFVVCWNFLIYKYVIYK